MKRTVHCLLLSGVLCSVPYAALAQGAPGTNQPTPMPPSTAGQAPTQGQQGMQHPPQSPEQQTQIQYKGKISDVWDTKVAKDQGDDKVVLIETDLGQVILADLGPEKEMPVKVEEGMPATVTGAMMYMEGENLRRFVPQQIQVGKQTSASGPVQAMPAKQIKAPQKQMVSGKIVAKEKMSAKETKVDQELIVVEVDPETRVLVDLGPSSALKNVKLKKGEQVQVQGQQTSINERAVLMAEKVNVKGKDVTIQRTALPEQQKQIPNVAPGQMPSQPPRQPTP